MHKVHSKGYTLVESMIAVGILTIVATMAGPSFYTMIQSSRMTSATNQFVASISYARHEAILRGANVNMSAIDPSSAANEWGKGWRVWIDNNGNTQYDNGEALRQVENKGTDALVDSVDNISRLSFSSRGVQTPLTEHNFTISLKGCGSNNKATNLRLNAIGGASTRKSTC